MTDADRVMARSVAGFGACIIWTGAKDHHGYGRIRADGAPARLTHRVVWASIHGPIPEGMQIDHLCRVRACVNPWHLEAVSPRVNVLRSDGIAARNAVKTECIHGHELDVANTMVYRGKRKCRVCARAACARWYERRKLEV